MSTVAHALASPRYCQIRSHSTFETQVDSVPMLVIDKKEAVGARVVF